MQIYTLTYYEQLGNRTYTFLQLRSCLSGVNNVCKMHRFTSALVINEWFPCVLLRCECDISNASMYFTLDMLHHLCPGVADMRNYSKDVLAFGTMCCCEHI